MVLRAIVTGTPFTAEPHQTPLYLTPIMGFIHSQESSFILAEIYKYDAVQNAKRKLERLKYEAAQQHKWADVEITLLGLGAVVISIIFLIGFKYYREHCRGQTNLQQRVSFTNENCNDFRGRTSFSTDPKVKASISRLVGDLSSLEARLEEGLGQQ